jgi:murein tripeptide amidase MpaA
MKNTLIAVLVIIIIALIGVGAHFLLKPGVAKVPVETVTTKPQEVTVATSTRNSPIEVIGTSVSGHAINAYHYGTGTTELLFVGGIHGGYSWNTSLVAYQFMDYLEANPSAVPANERVTIIPELDPDGLAKIIGHDGRFQASDIPAGVNTVPGRFNGNGVDVNRNFDCDWKASGVWQNQTVSGGSSAFSEPESQAIRDYTAAHSLTAVISWFSSAGGVYASNCHDGVLPETETLTNLYAKASGYKPYESYDFYQLTGDMANWFAKKGIPAISVLLTTHTDTEWSKNQPGIAAVLAHYAK